MTSAVHVDGERLAEQLGRWRQGGSRRGADDLAAAVEGLVLDGTLQLGARLPAERELADALGVSRALVGAALEKLRDGGIVASKRGAGSWVTAPRGINPEPPRDGLIDLAQAATPAGPGLMRAVDAARDHFAAELLDHGYRMRGVSVLRERIAERYTARGLPTTPEQVLVTSGAQHAFALALRAFTGPGDRVLIDEPGYPNTPEAIRGAHAVPVAVGVDPVHGWDLPTIEAVLRQSSPRLACFVVDFQNPTGLRMTAADRERLGGVLARSRTPFVVDETLAELDLEGDEGDPVDGPPPFAAFGGEWAITIGSASKSHWGGLRLGWVRAPEEAVARLVSARTSLDLGSPVFEQLVLAEQLADADVLPRRRRELRELRDALVDAVRTRCPQWTFRVPGGGLSLWCRLPEPVATRLSAAAANHGVRVVPGSRFGAHPDFESWLRLPFTQPADRLREAVDRLSLASAAVRPTASLDAPVT